VPFTGQPLLLPRAPCDFPLVASAARGPRLAASAGSVFSVWQDSDAARLLLQRLDAGTPVFAEPLQLETPPGSVTSPTIAAWGTGGLVVVWQQGTSIVGQRLASDGRALEPPFAVSTPSATSVHEMPAVAATARGEVAVAWRDRHDGVVDVGLRQMRRCGNGNVDPGEQCDDGNTVAGDCCAPDCQIEPNGQACDDGRFCTLATTCNLGVCNGGTPRDCGDANACTADRCDEPSGRCVNDAALLTGVACDDGNACTQQDACSNGSCQGSSVVCDDANPCTNDFCDPAIGCGVTNADGATCSDGDECTEPDVCAQGACVGTRVCGPNLPPGGNNGGGSGGGGGVDGLPQLPSSRKGVIKLTCIGPRRASCRTVLFQGDAATGVTGAQIAKPKRAKIGKKGQVVLKIKLNKAGRSALAAAGNRLQVILDTTVVERDGTTRQTVAAALLTGQERR
jgi:cysteine-rich repeat protein